MRPEIAMLVAAAAWLAACAPAPQSSPTWVTCKSIDGDSAQLARRAAACAEDMATAYRLHGDAVRDQGEPAAALADFNAALRLAPDDPEAHDGRGRAETDLNALDKAAADFADALKLDPLDADALTDLGYLERQRGDLPAALHDEDRAIELKPDWAEPWEERGEIFLAERRFDMALADLAEAVRLDAKRADALDASAVAQTGKGDVKDALAAYGQAEDLYINRGDLKLAVADTDKALALAPADPEALNAACWTRAIADTDLSAAEQDCQKSLAIHPGAADVLDSLAFVEYRQGRLQAAIQDYSAALAHDPKQASSLYMRGIAKLRAGDPGGQADIDAAQSADATVAATFASYGVTAPGAGDNGG
jgi:tetratricopeptide (TPR) repeat protein